MLSVDEALQHILRDLQPLPSSLRHWMNVWDVCWLKT